MANRLQGKKAVITAAAQGIGRASVIAMLDEGAQVIATDINEQALQALQSEFPQVQTKVLNVLDEEAINAFAAETGAINVLFNCAGFVHNGTILDCSDKDWDFFIQFKRQINVSHDQGILACDGRVGRC